MSTVCFCAGNYTLSYLSKEAGFYTIFYYSVGSTFISILYYVVKMRKQYKSNGTIWPDQNIIKQGKIKCINLFRFMLICLTYFLAQVMICLTLYYAALAQVNSGLITTIWSLTPFFFALVEYKVFGTSLQINHYIGMILILICSVLLSLTKVIYPEGN